MSAVWFYLAVAWDWVTGLRITTRAERDRMAGVVKWYQRKAAQATLAERNAYRVVTLLSEPLKDWDLADFPAWAEGPGTVFLESYRVLGYYAMSLEDLEHIRNVVQAYRVLSGDLARMRMTAKTNDRIRGRGYDDAPLSPAGITALGLDPRRLP